MPGFMTMNIAYALLWWQFFIDQIQVDALSGSHKASYEEYRQTNHNQGSHENETPRFLDLQGRPVVERRR